ncbi:MAG: class I tRNA ligase family protein, partial [Oscillospiraceae bacterium]|nr:class I tRNA ligase family protein [Oscillospiraceae bacterium]
MEYKNTIITPKTEFPMRAGLPQREPGMLENWNKIDVYKLLMEKNAGKPRFILHDGPPFSNGDLHMGHALNKALKDFIVRSYAMRGYYTPFTPGWDNHGMPIESAIIKKNKLNHKTMPAAEFRTACENFAQDFINRQRTSFRRLGYLGDWERPYRTMDKSFEAEEVKVFGEMFRKGYIYKGLKPVYWCPKDETALAEAEIEYQDDPCTSIYVKFALKDTQGKLDPTNTYVIIWTTTPWTLPGNLAIALSPRDTYVLVQAGEVRYIVAEALLEKTMAAGGVAEYEILERYEGSFFEYMTAQHPFLDRDSLLVTADYVTMDSGTGCVHTAPGFGADDYQTCRRYKIDLIVPVDDRGIQTADAGKYAGLRYDVSNTQIVEDMKADGSLFASEVFTHSYPHCWRCKSPIIF